MARSPKLKVFCTPVGFHNALVAAPSQKAALKAWGTATDLFAAGRASVVEDPELQALALARPGEVVKHSRGDEAAILGRIEEEERNRAQTQAQAPQKPRPGARQPKSPSPDRSELDQAERDLDHAKRDLEKQLAQIARRRTELEAEERTVRFDGEARVFELERVRDQARRAYDRALNRSR